MFEETITELVGRSFDLDLYKALRANFYYIVINIAPVLAVSDARVLAKQADAIALVVH